MISCSFTQLDPFIHPYEAVYVEGVHVCVVFHSMDGRKGTDKHHI